MLKAPKVYNEIERLKSLAEYAILDTAPEASYDNLTKLAAEICQTPISLVSVVDSQRQWFKSRVGLEALETPRDISFCGHAIAGKELFVVSNARADERFSDNPLVTGDAEIAFYAGAPLMSNDGFALGTLCVIDRRARELNEFQKRALQTLSEQIVHLMELRRSERKLSEKVAELQKQAKLVVSQQEEIVHAARIASFAEMASSLGHEMNNPLAIISGKSQVLIQRLSRSDIPVVEILKSILVIEQTTSRLSYIVKSLSQFAKNPSMRSGLGEPVERLLKMVLSSLSVELENIQISYSGDLSVSCEVRSDEIVQAIRHLVKNSIEALTASELKSIDIVVRSTPKRVQILVVDSGPGIDPKLNRSILDPFSTSKTVKQGVGLGLNIAHGLIHANAGTLEFDKEAKHTTFIVDIPRSLTE